MIQKYNQIIYLKKDQWKKQVDQRQRECRAAYNESSLQSIRDQGCRLEFETDTDRKAVVGQAKQAVTSIVQYCNQDLIARRRRFIKCKLFCQLKLIYLNLNEQIQAAKFTCRRREGTFGGASDLRPARTRLGIGRFETKSSCSQKWKRARAEGTCQQKENTAISVNTVLFEYILKILTWNQKREKWRGAFIATWLQ